jgi:hypothetical protein
MHFTSPLFVPLPQGHIQPFAPQSGAPNLPVDARHPSKRLFATAGPPKSIDIHKNYVSQTGELTENPGFEAKNDFLLQFFSIFC